jgi:hypothetical protein
LRDFAAADGLMSYGTSLADAYGQAGVYAGHRSKRADNSLRQVAAE